MTPLAWALIPVTMLLGAAMWFAMRYFLAMEEAAPAATATAAAAKATRPPPQPEGTRRWPQRQSEPERRKMDELRTQVKADVLVAAGALCEAQAADADELQKRVKELKCMCEALTTGGQHGRVAMTDFCNALLEADALDVLNKLQSHADASTAADATFVFQKAVVLIYDIG